MKIIRYISLIIAVAILSMASSCNKNSEDYSETTLTLNATAIDYNSNGVWSNTFVPETNLTSQGIFFSHSGQSTPYELWSGFAPSRNSDTTDHTSDSWTDHQWSVMSGGGMSGAGTPFLVGYWNTSEAADVKIDEASCVISYGTDTPRKAFSPISLFLNNSTWSYYAMKNGTNFNKKFSTGDYCKLLIYGYNNGVKVGPVEAYLADYRSSNPEDWKILSDWTFVNLDILGEVQYLYFQMESTDSGKWGMNNPSYFCIDRLKIKM